MIDCAVLADARGLRHRYGPELARTPESRPSSLIRVASSLMQDASPLRRFVLAHRQPAILLLAAPLLRGARDECPRLDAAAIDGTKVSSASIAGDDGQDGEADESLERTREWASGTNGFESPLVDPSNRHGTLSPLTPSDESSSPFRIDPDPLQAPTTSYSLVVEQDADRGHSSGENLRRTLGQTLKPVVANSAWLRLIDMCDPTGSDSLGLLDLVGPLAQLESLVGFLARALRPSEHVGADMEPPFALALVKLKDRSLTGSLEISATLVGPESSKVQDDPTADSVLMLTTTLRIDARRTQTITPSMSSLPTARRDLTLYKQDIARTEIGRQILALDWSQLPVGPLETWSEAALAALSFCMASHVPTAWFMGDRDEKGEDPRALFYNASYAEFAGAKHPAILGTRGADAWKEVWNDLKGPLDGVQSGEPIYTRGTLFFIDRQGRQDPMSPRTEET